MTQSDEDLVVVDVDLKESDLQRANFWFGLRSWSNRLMLLVMPLAAVLLMLRLDVSAVFRKPFTATLVFVLLTFPPFYFGFIWFNTKRGFGNLQSFQTRIQYTFSPNGYIVRDDKSSADISWQSILQAAESKHSFHLFFHKSGFHTVPKRCFKQGEDIARLRHLLKGALGTKATVA